ncbi:MAG: 2,3-bisphosphoglycerate-independent phosphoglycerate mutase [Deltaproteobacteria bacterium]|nr:2,3-bisphosphoglycerate-independent phosphoglycerate mutase [Deltaproteobacteria bacterium]
MPSKCILILLDGLGDRAYVNFGHKTPLQAAETPNLDRLARLGSNGLFHGKRQGMALPSEEAHFALFGYRQKEFPGRGILEAHGAGIPVSPDDVAVLAHLVSVTEENRVLVLKKDRPEASGEEIDQLIKALSPFETDGIEVSFVQTRNLDGIIVIKGAASPHFTDSDPLQEGMPVIEIQPLNSAQANPEAQTTSMALKRFLLDCYTRLKGHQVNSNRQMRKKCPINALVTQRPGRFRPVDSFTRRWGLRGLSISSGLIYWGLCNFIGMEVLKAHDSLDPGKDLADRIELALSNVRDFDFVHVHTKAPDSAAHTKNPHLKKDVIESLDRGLGNVLNTMLDDPELLLVITSDHSTPSSGPLIHSGEPVPITVVGTGVRRDDVERFDEIRCASGALGFVTGDDFMPLVLNFLDRTKLRGLMDTPEDQPYWPGLRKPFSLK